MNEQDPSDSVNEKAGILKKQRLTQEEQKHAEIQRIADVSVQARHHELLWVIDGRGDTVSACGELPKAAQIDRCPEAEWKQRHELRDRPCWRQPESSLIEDDAG